MINNTSWSFLFDSVLYQDSFDFGTTVLLPDTPPWEEKKDLQVQWIKKESKQEKQLQSSSVTRKSYRQGITTSKTEYP